LGLVVLAIGGHAFWGWREEKKLREDLRELWAKGEPMDIEEFKVEPVPLWDNQAAWLKEAGDLIDERTDSFDRLMQEKIGFPLSQEQMELVGRVVAENQKALGKLRRVKDQKGVDWGINLTRSSIFSSPQALLDMQKNLSVLAGAKMIYEHQKGNDREAIALAMDLLIQCEAMDRMPNGLATHLASSGVGELGSETLQQVVPEMKIGTGSGEVTPADMRKLIDRLLNDSELKSGLKRALQFERAAQVLAARTMYQMDESGRVGPGQNSQASTPILGYLAKPLFLRDGRLMLRNVTEIMSASEADSLPAFNARAKESFARMSHVRESPKLHMLAVILTPPYEPVVKRTYRAITSRRLAAVALAARWHFLERGRWPKNLEELVPNYLPAVPLDAMGEHKNIGYVAEEERPRVYSVGENLTDEGGSDKPLPKKVYNVGTYRWWDEDAVVDLKRQKRTSVEESEKE
jgi:hypothetical protein